MKTPSKAAKQIGKELGTNSPRGDARLAVDLAKPSPFDELVRKMPSALVGGFDPLTHKTANDLYMLADHELDLDFAGDITLAPRIRNKIRDYRQMCAAFRK